VSTVLIADDEVVFCMQFEEQLIAFGHKVVTAHSGEEAVCLAVQAKPDLILMDIVMPGSLNGIDAANIIQSQIDSNIVFITGCEDRNWLEKAELCFPAGYLYKPVSVSQLYAVINISLRNKSNYGFYSLTRKLSDIGVCLSPAEIKVAVLVKIGKSSKQIADILNLSVETVNSHRKSIRKKLNITSSGDILETYLSALN
jgi:DNA-binding NarL/FixJ family response regulator